jgi:DNA polymerase-3 subunit chi
MTEVLFYHLERASLEGVLPGLLERTLERGWKAVVRCGSLETVARLEEILWTYSDDSFLPHASGAERAAMQPIWITADELIPNGADILFLVEHASADASKINEFARCVTIFDGGDEKAVANARALWKDVKAAAHEATYWKQSLQGRWEKQA